MSATAFNIVMLAAIMHAGWNAIVKGGQDKMMITTLILIFAAVISGIGLLFSPVPAVESWPYLTASIFLQVAYFALVAATYRIADMSQTYPLMRGTAPLIVTIISAIFLSEALSLPAWAGIGLICGGIFALTLGTRGTVGRGTWMALLTACVIATYTMVDGLGVRLSGTALSYTLWINLLTAIPFALWLVFVRAPSLDYLRKNWHLGLIGGLGTLLSYGLALWAMTHAPIAMVAALRESSILFATIISAVILKEHIGLARLMAALLILAGAIAIRLG